jgi:hypothetical protein
VLRRVLSFETHLVVQDAVSFVVLEARTCFFYAVRTVLLGVENYVVTGSDDILSRE